MLRPPARVLPVSVLAALALLTAAACTSGRSGRAVETVTSPSAARPAAPASVPPSAALTQEQAQEALLTEADLDPVWAPTQEVATWRDGVLKARTEVPDCQRLLDALYADEPLGAPSGARAVAAFDDGDDEAQLRYQVLAVRAPDADRALAWLGSLPQTCPGFTATTTRSGVQDVRVTGLALPDVGDARQGLRVTFTGDSATLTLDVAAVRIGDDAITLTTGALGTPPENTVTESLPLGTDRLTAVHHQERVQA
ncbi:hypothetical protein C1I97_36450 [Streptomyces sp. NTH33]|uniref:hypothetical protein n=1 Tax=Streptomyces sp. NTH33 TaxID=1735453 RepID=UPI000DA8F121|nr:hypothetical protein [Streptomyces sp. NTH33]PZG78717.1 hypothetical protein C1I97_36450 [Streptomyces sp. NTH33]